MDAVRGDDRRRRAAALAAALFALAAGLALRASLVEIPLERDEGEYAYVAWRWLEGEVPYRDTVNRKPPAIFAIYALCFETLGASPAAIHRGLALWLGAAQLALFGFARRLAGTSVALGAALLFALVTASPGFHGNAAQIESFAALPIVLGAWLAHLGARTGSLRAAAGTGLAAGALLLLKPVTAPIAALLLAWLVFGAPHRPGVRVRLAAAYATAIAACLGALVAGFAHAGALGALYDATVRLNVGYATEVPLRNYPEQLVFGLAGTLPALAPVYALLAIGLVLPRGSGGSSAIRWRSRGWVGAWLATAFLAASASGYYRQHHFLYMAAPLALLAAAALADLAAAARLPLRARRHAPWAGALAAIAFAVAANPAFHLPGDPAAKSRALYGANPFPESPAFAAFVAEHSSADDRLFVFGSEPQIQFLARRRNTGRYALAYHYLPGPPAQALARQLEVLGALRADPPRFLATALYDASLLESPRTPRAIHQGLTALLRERYAPIAELRLRAEGIAELDVRPETLAKWRADPRLESPERPGYLVLWERAEPLTRP